VSRAALFLLLVGWPVFSLRAQSSLIVTDLLPDLFHFLEVAPNERADQAKLFADLVIKPHPEIYNRPDVFKTDLTSLQDYLGQLQTYLPAIREIHARFQRQRAAVERDFVNAFPDFDSSRARIYPMLSLFRFDGKIPSNNPHQLLLGIDGIAKFHGATARLSVIISHELFHLYHFQVNPIPVDPDALPLYRLIWQEGLATYVSQRLNPGSSLADVLLDPRLAEEGPRFVPVTAQQLLTQLESTDDATAATYLLSRRGSQAPGRMGYLIGYEIAKNLGETRSLHELALLRGPFLLHIITGELKGLAADVLQ
jgi:predicted Zn-dependent protease DUF2268